MLFLSCKTSFELKWTEEEAPVYFTTKFETPKGDFEIESRKEWFPIAQFGIHNDSIITSALNNFKIEYEPVLKINTKGTVCFARGGPRSRGTNLFITTNHILHF